MEEQIEKGTSFLSQEQWDEALKCFSKAIEIDPNNPTAYFLKGELLKQLGQKKEALNCFNKLVELFPTEANIYNVKAVLLEEMGDDNEALKYFSKAIELDPNMSMAYNSKGTLLKKLGKFNEALQCFNKSIELEPENFESYNRKGLLLEKIGQKNEALQCFDKAIELNCDEVDAYRNKGNLLKNLGQQNEAQKYFDKVAELDPNAGYNGEAQDDTDLLIKNEFIQQFNKTTELDPNSSHEYHNKGLILLESGQKDKSLEHFNKSIEFNPYNLIAYTSRAKLYLSENKNQLAFQDIKYLAMLLDEGSISTKISEENPKQLKNTLHDFEIIEKSNKQISEKVKQTKGTEQEKNQINQEANKLLLELTNKAVKNLIESIIPLVQAFEYNQSQVSEDIQKQNKEKHDENVELKNIIQQLEQKLEQKDLSFKYVLQCIQQSQELFNKLNKIVENVGNKVENSGQKEKTQLNKELESLQKEGQDVFNYYLAFYWISLNVFLTYRVLSTEQMKANYKSNTAEFLESSKEQIKDGLKIGQEVGKEICKGTIKSVPVVGNIFSFIDTVVDMIIQSTVANKVKLEKTHFFNRVNSINKVIQAKFATEENISIMLAQTTIKLAKLRKDAIRNPTLLQNENQTELKTKYFDMIQKVDDAFFVKEELSDKNSTAIQLALKDASLLISYLCQNSSEIILLSDPATQILVDLVQKKTIENQLDQKLIAAKETDKKCSCQIF